ncbi:hypothetical protein BDZ45DRAFT_692159 [Acephala macrosclerotiorum]|nr:hypothetical protein BDZ45DRAFT_692159 [Acephala macrosclerotiorum]
MYQFSALPSPLSPRGARNPNDQIIRTGMARKDRKLNNRRARQVPLPENVSYLRRLVLMYSPPRRISNFLVNSYNMREHKYDKAGRVKIKFVEKWIESKSPEKKSAEEENFMEEMRKMVAEEELAMRSRAMDLAGDNEFMRLNNGETCHDAHHYESQATHEKEKKSDSSGKSKSPTTTAKHSPNQIKGRSDEQARRQYEEIHAREKAKIENSGSWEIAKTTSANEKVLGSSTSYIRFGDMDPVHITRSPRAVSSIPTTSPLRKCAPRGVRIPSTTTYQQNVVSDLAKAPAHPRGPGDEALESVESLATAFGGQLRIL